MIQIKFNITGQAEHIKKIQNTIFKLASKHDVLLKLDFTIDESKKQALVQPYQIDKNFNIKDDLEFKKFYEDLIDKTEDKNFFYVELIEFK